MDWASMVKRNSLMIRKKPKSSLKKKVIKGLSGCNPCVAKPTAPHTTSEIVNEFINNTTLIGIPHIIKKKSLFWLLAYCACMSLSVYQSWQSATNYIEQSSHQSASVKNRMTLPWPSITICNNVVLHLSFLNRTAKAINFVNISKLDCKEQLDQDHVEDIRDKNKQNVLEYVRSNLTEEQRWSQSLSRPEWIEKCWFNYEPCNFTDTNTFFEFNNPYDGNCFTFNPTFNLTDGISTDIDTKLIVHFRRYGIGYQLRGKKSYVSLLVHSPGTTPLMDLPEAIDIFDRQNINLGLRLIVNDFMLKARTVVPTCVADTPTGEVFRKKNFYYNETLTPYKYSVEACMKWCVQNKVNTPCGVLDATFPVLHEFYEILNARQPPIPACKETENVNIGMDQCQCPFPCRYYQYLVSSDTSELEKDTNPSCDVESEDEETTVYVCMQANLGLFLFAFVCCVHRRSMRVSVQFQSNIYSYNEEVLDYDLTQFLGFLGGNVSLWLGLCVLSLLEVLELIWDLITMNLQRVCHKRRGRQHPTNNDESNRVRTPYGYPGYSVTNRMARAGIRPITSH